MKKKLLSIFIIISILFGILISIWFIYRGYSNEGFINPSTKIDNDISAKFGDFIGGVVGTIFSLSGILLLFKTLNLQRKELTESRNVFIKQQFDNTFFELLKLHKTNLSQFEDYDLLRNKLTGVEYLNYERDKLQNNFINKKNINKNRKLGIENFELTYSQKGHNFSMYFRTLYRIYCHIIESDITEKDKVNYSKILRAQISEPELFFIRYNAMSESGTNSREYINRYNLLKQLSSFDLLEFKHWWNGMIEFEKNGLGTVFNQIKQEARLLLKDKDYPVYENTFKNGRYKIILTSQNEGILTITINRFLNKNSNQLSITNGLDRMTIKDLRNLLKCYLKEIFIYSNFNKFNNRNEILIDSNMNFNSVQNIENASASIKHIHLKELLIAPKTT
ncbi:hypothetical protein PG911_16665 [Tenacibaculum ovolyticum]|uniref:putative phage abortive infection protein n=1 Tax=Tenacibaculum ovolyticum TaxID=104270 RepID=UPI0022F37DA1|nr:putative phage abortive infection protein [Tenacibaculum ovolyticum]WBX76237.1 hypothetical protein PG911_16665 [Tenacibaculum ovolyticum]